MILEKPIRLLDTTSSFVITIDEMEDIEIPYGNFSLSLMNTDFEKIQDTISTYIRNNEYVKELDNKQQEYNTIINITPKMADKILSGLFHPLKEIIFTEYLSVGQANAITYLLIYEIKQNILDQKMTSLTVVDFFPAVFFTKEFQNHIRESLLMKSSAFTSELQNEINQTEISTAFLTLEEGIPMTAYYLENTFAYLILDLHKYLLSPKRVIECAYCKRLFIPKYRKSEIYCKLPHKDTDKTCNQIMLHSKEDDFAKVRNSARGYQHSRCNNDSTKKQYEENFLVKIYDDWSLECTERYLKYKLEDDLDGFKDWVNDTKFTAKRIEELHQQYSK